VTDGLLVVDKPRGPTSHDVVDAVRKAAGVRRVGHAGTLDPMATGVVVVGVGRSTRLLRFVQDQPKEYLATVRFGIGTDTLDAEGAEVWREPMDFERSDLEASLMGFIGAIEQVPPMFSAVKVGGRPLHRAARRGEEVARPPRTVAVHELELLDFEPGEFPLAKLKVVCSKGTYVRVLAEDVAKSLSGRGHLVALRRLRVGDLRADEAVAMADLAGWRSHLLDPVAAVTALPQMLAEPEEAAAVAAGRSLPSIIEGEFAVLDSAGGLLAVYRGEAGVARPEVVLA
jgi:tRNA pseudouridine55 synthase